MVGVSAVSILFADGFESGSYSGWAATTVSGTGSTLTANAGSAYAGSYGSDALVTGAGGNEASCVSASSVPSTNIISVQCRFKVHQNNVGSGEAYFFGPRNAGGTRAVYLENNAGTWNLIYTNRAVATVRAALTQQVFTVDQFYLMEINVDWSGANQVYTCYINGVLDTTSTDSSAGSNIVYSTVWGGIYTATGMTGNFETYTDEYKLGDAYIGLPSGVVPLPEQIYAPAYRAVAGWSSGWRT